MPIPPRNPAPARWTLLLALVVAATAGCAYFNLFYNAQKNFEEGEQIAREVDPRNQPTSTQKTKYQTAIRKATMLLEEYPDSDYIDDALFLIGKSHFRLKEWSDAIRNFDNVLANFPKSSFVEETMYLKSLAHLSRGEESVGLEWFARLREAYPEGAFGVEAVYRLGDAYAEDGKFDEAIRYYGEYLERFPDHEDRARVVLSQARVLFERERYEEVVAALDRFDTGDVTKSERFEVQWLRLSALNELGRSEEAAEGLEVLENSAELSGERAKMLLLKGQIELRRGDQQRGILTLEALAEEFKGQDTESEARAAIVEHLLEEEGPESEVLREQMKIATEGRSRGTGGARIRERKQQLERFDRLKERYSADDSTSVDAAFGLAQLLLIDFDHPERSLEYYRAVLERDPEHGLAPKAAYAVGYIESAHLDRPDDARATFAQLQERYPESTQAKALAGEVFLEGKPKDLETLLAEQAAATSRTTGGADRRGPRTSDTGELRSSSSRSLRFGGPGATTPRARGIR